MMRKNFIKDLPDNRNAAVDESLMLLQVRVRKGTEWETALRDWLAIQTNGNVSSLNKEVR